MLYKCVCMYSCTAGGPCYINVYVCIHAQQVSPCYINVYVHSCTAGESMLYKCVCMYSCTAGGPCYINVYVCIHAQQVVHAI